MIIMNASDYANIDSKLALRILSVLNHYTYFEVKECLNRVIDPEASRILQTAIDRYDEWLSVDTNSDYYIVASMTPIEFSLNFEQADFGEKVQMINIIKYLSEVVSDLEYTLEYNDSESLYHTLLEDLYRCGISTDVAVENRDILVAKMKGSSKIAILKQNKNNIKAIRYGLSKIQNFNKFLN